jgi:methionyl-tRNA formyltransferase
MKIKLRIALIGKSNKPFINQIIKICKKRFSSVDVFISDNKKQIIKKLKRNRYDIIISYLSLLVLPTTVLKKTKKYNINFHPGPPKYPGVGCFNYAIFNKDKFYGCTAHIMEKRIDSGKIIDVSMFKISGKETVETLCSKTYKKMFSLFKKIIKKVENENLNFKKIKWSKFTYKRRDLNKLSTININTKKEAIDRFIRSTYHPGYPFPLIKINKHIFVYKKK